MKTTKILSALLLLAVSLGLFKFAYITSNAPAALAALIIGALFIYSGISLTMDEEEYKPEIIYYDVRKSGKLEKGTPILILDKEPSFKEKIKKETVRLNAVETGTFKPTTITFKRNKKGYDWSPETRKIAKKVGNMIRKNEGK